MHVGPPRIVPPPAVVLPLVRVDQARLEQIVRECENARQKRQLSQTKRALRQRALRQERRDIWKAARLEQAAALLAHVAPRFGMTPADLRGASKTRDVVTARHTAMFLLTTVSGFTVGQAAHALGRGHHTTAMAALRVVRCRMAVDAEYAAVVAALEGELRTKMETPK